jgi:hypothetical protein
LISFDNVFVESETADTFLTSVLESLLLRLMPAGFSLVVFGADFFVTTVYVGVL